MFGADTAVSGMVQQFPPSANAPCSYEIAAVLKGVGIWNFRQEKEITVRFAAYPSVERLVSLGFLLPLSTDSDE